MLVTVDSGSAMTIIDEDEPLVTPARARELIAFVEKRSAIAEAAGGIPVEDVEDGVCEVPEGWWFDALSWYYLPPDFQFGSDSQN